MTSTHALPMDTSENTNVEELIRSEGISDDEWQRIFELRYCTILVPFAEDYDAESQGDIQDLMEEEEEEEEEGEDEDEERDEQSIGTQPSTPKVEGASRSGQEQQQLPTPKSIQRPQSLRQRSRTVSPSKSPARHTGMPSPLERRSAKAMSRNTDQSIEDVNMDLGEDQDMDDLDGLNDSTLTPDDPLSTYLAGMRSRGRDGTQGMGIIVDATGNHSNNVGDIQSAEQKIARGISASLVQHGNLGRRDSPAQSSKRPLDEADSTTSSDAGAKRRHWELSPSTRLLQPKHPDLTKQSALATSPSIPYSPVSPSGLMKPRSYTPSTSPLSFLQSRLSSSNVSSLQRDVSFTSNISTTSQWSRNAKTLWTKQDWQTLEALYNEMDGNSMEEAGLTQVADRFLTEQMALTGSKPRWTRVRHDKNEGSEHQFPFTAADASRRHRSGTRRAAPYPVDVLRGQYPGGTSSSAMTEFRNRRRSEQNRKQSALDQGYSLKSVFKHRFASGLRTVGQLLPFWRDVELGNTDIKEKVTVPLVPAGSAQSVIEAFESQVEEEARRSSRGAFTQRCQDCDQVYYCSSTCKELAMDPKQGAHGKICKTFRKLATWNSDRHTKSIIKLLLQVLMNHWRERQGLPSLYQSRKLMQMRNESVDASAAEATTVMTAATNESTGAAAITSAPSSPSSSAAADTGAIAPEAQELNAQEDGRKGKVQEPVENDFYDVLRLQSHYEDWDDEDTKDWNRQAQVVLSLLELSELNEIRSEPDGPLQKLTAVDIKKLVSALESNAFGMFDRTRKKPVCFGRAIYPIASFFNHSCECNATAVQADGSEEVTSGDVLRCSEAYGSNQDQPSTPESVSVSASVTASSTPSTPTSSEEVDSITEASALAGTESGTVEGEQAGEAAVAPNPFASRVGEFRMMTFFAVSDISKGQDITISYIDTEAPLHARRLALLSDYHFHCLCARCMREERTSNTGKGNSQAGKGGGKRKTAGGTGKQKSTGGASPAGGIGRASKTIEEPPCFARKHVNDPSISRQYTARKEVSELPIRSFETARKEVGGLPTRSYETARKAVGGPLILVEESDDDEYPFHPRQTARKSVGVSPILPRETARKSVGESSTRPRETGRKSVGGPPVSTQTTLDQYFGRPRQDTWKSVGGPPAPTQTTLDEYFVRPRQTARKSVGVSPVPTEESDDEYPIRPRQTARKSVGISPISAEESDDEYPIRPRQTARKSVGVSPISAEESDDEYPIRPRQTARKSVGVSPIPAEESDDEYPFHPRQTARKNVGSPPL
ncbi:hypothetical protein BGZ50_006778 [Haplosporangium sp. Z 11]|nr:hypothetical protein BGZ50_006778 [Haplosporangium sp. Z 11]